MNLDTIVISTDLSEQSLTAITPGFSLASKGTGKVYLLSVVEEFVAAPHGAPLAPPVTPLDTDHRIADVKKSLEEWRQSKGLNAEVVVLSSNDIAHAVTEFAEEKQADLLILATHGRTGFRHLVLGSVAEAILRHAKVPVLTFPRPKK